MKLTLRKVLCLLSGLVGIAALFLFLAAPLQTPATEVLGQTIPAQPLPYDEVFFGNEIKEGAIAGFIGFILFGVGGLVAILNAFIGKKKATGANKLLTIASVLLFVVGVVLVFLTKTFYLAELGDAAETVGKALELGPGTIIGGIMGAAAAIINLPTLFLKK